ncbi:MAG: hypothetical protein Q8O56_12795 [Solirubrobacteraceae bacterium]|nr:hypothetical protein [Solirubrobacteraceae bacterium]
MLLDAIERMETMAAAFEVRGRTDIAEELTAGAQVLANQLDGRAGADVIASAALAQVQALERISRSLA